MEQKIVELLGQLQTSVSMLAPEVWTALVYVTRIESIIVLAASIMGLAFGCVYFLHWFKRLRVWADEVGSDIDVLVVLGSTAVAAVVTIFAIITLLTPSLWIGVFYPEALVIRDMLTKVTG